MIEVFWMSAKECAYQRWRRTKRHLMSKSGDVAKPSMSKHLCDVGCLAAQFFNSCHRTPIWNIAKPLDCSDSLLFLLLRIYNVIGRNMFYFSLVRFDPSPEKTLCRLSTHLAPVAAAGIAFIFQANCAYTASVVWTLLSCCNAMDIYRSKSAVRVFLFSWSPSSIWKMIWDGGFEQK